MLKNALTLSHEVLAKFVHENDVVVDATCGKGNDTMFLSRLVGERGRVYSFDIQDIAINITKSKIAQNGDFGNIEFICDGHQNMDKYIKDVISAVVFNLGYFPTGDHTIATRADTTIVAINKALTLLKVNGIIVVVVYSGGDTGFQEKKEVLEFASKLNPRGYGVTVVDFPNQVNNPPVLLCIEKLA